MGVHAAAGSATLDDAADDARAARFLTRYLEFCRSRVAPRLSEAAARSLAGQYVELREQAREGMEGRGAGGRTADAGGRAAEAPGRAGRRGCRARSAHPRPDTPSLPSQPRPQVRAVAAGGNGDAPAVPVTVRQLEAIVRISESLARMQLLPEASQEHVRQAVELFTASTMHAVKAGVADVVFSDEQRAELHAVEAQVRRRLPIGGYASERRLVDDLVRCGVSESLARRALAFMARQGELDAVRERRLIHRVR